MNKFILALLCFACTTTLTANAVVDSTSADTVKVQSRETKVFYILESNGYVTQKNGKIEDLKKPFDVGSKLYLKFSDGFDTTYTAKAGDTRWVVAGTLLDYLETLHGSLTTKPAPKLIPQKAATVPWWVIGLFAALVATIGYFAFITPWLNKRKETARMNENPTTAGPAFTTTGITNENAVPVMENAARLVFETTAPIEVIRMERGTIIKADATEVFFNGAPIRRFNIKNQPAVRAIVRVGEEQGTRTVYALQLCGNPIRQGQFIVGDIQFIPDAMNSEIPTQVEEAEIIPDQPTATSQAFNTLPNIIKQLQETGGGTLQLSSEDVTVVVQVEGKTEMHIDVIHFNHTNNHTPKEETVDQTHH
jgi:hypothetical protein